MGVDIGFICKFIYVLYVRCVQMFRCMYIQIFKRVRDFMCLRLSLGYIFFSVCGYWRVRIQCYVFLFGDIYVRVKVREVVLVFFLGRVLLSFTIFLKIQVYIFFFGLVLFLLSCLVLGVCGLGFFRRLYDGLLFLYLVVFLLGVLFFAGRALRFEVIRFFFFRFSNIDLYGVYFDFKGIKFFIFRSEQVVFRFFFV